MGYSQCPIDDTPGQINGALNHQKEYDQKLIEHQKSDECTHKPDCPECIRLKALRDSFDPTLP